MKTALLIKILQYVVGKNKAHIARKIVTLIGGFLMAPAIIDAAVNSGIAIEGFQPVTADEIGDGLTAGELIRTVLGMALFAGSRAMSYFRARKLDWAADWVGIFIGRSIHSLYRALLTATAGLLTFLGFSGGSVEGVTSVPVIDIVGALIALLVAGISSSLQDTKINPVAPVEGAGSPPKNRLW